MSHETIYLIRHATPDWERRDIVYHLPPGPPLTDQGRGEADALGAFLLAAGVRRLHTSPLERALHTARIAAGIAGAAVEVDDRLIEWQPTEGAERVHQRMWAAVDALRLQDGCAKDGACSPVGLVSHGGPIGSLLLAFGMDAAMLEAQRRFDHANPVPPAGAWEAWRDSPEAPWQLRLAFIPQGIEIAN